MWVSCIVGGVCRSVVAEACFCYRVVVGDGVAPEAGHGADGVHGPAVVWRVERRVSPEFGHDVPDRSGFIGGQLPGVDAAHGDMGLEAEVRRRQPCVQGGLVELGLYLPEGVGVPADPGPDDVRESVPVLEGVDAVQVAAGCSG